MFESGLSITCASQCWKSFRKQSESSGSAVTPLTRSELFECKDEEIPSFPLTKGFAVSAYLILQRSLTEKGSKDLTGVTVPSARKHRRHQQWKPILKDVLLFSLSKHWCQPSSHLPCESLADHTYEDVRSVQIRALGMDRRTKKAYLKEPYILGSLTNGQLESEESLALFEGFKQSQMRTGLTDSSVDPFSEFSFSVPVSDLTKQPRMTCPKCSRRSHLYCPQCKIPFPLIETEVEHSASSSRKRTLSAMTMDDSSVVDSDVSHSSDHHPTQLPCLDGRLPVSVEIIRHPKEAESVASSVHACVVCPSQVTMRVWPDTPDLTQPGTFVLFPDESAEFIDEMKDVSLIKSVIVIENKWTGNTPIIEALKHLPKLQIRKRETLYWRFQEKSKEYLSTIEAIYYALREINERKGVCSKELDDLLLLFAHDHHRVRQRVSEEDSPRLPKIWIDSKKRAS